MNNSCTFVFALTLQQFLLKMIEWEPFFTHFMFFYCILKANNTAVSSTAEAEQTLNVKGKVDRPVLFHPTITDSTHPAA